MVSISLHMVGSQCNPNLITQGGITMSYLSHYTGWGPNVIPTSLYETGLQCHTFFMTQGEITISYLPHYTGWDGVGWRFIFVFTSFLMSPYLSTASFHTFSVADPVDVAFGLGLINILNVDEKSQVFKLKVWEKLVSNMIILISVYWRS